MDYWELLLGLLFLRLFFAFRPQSKSVLIVLGSGGHTGEMVTLLSSLSLSKFGAVATLRARGDDGSLKLLEAKCPDAGKFRHYTIVRSRSVGQSYVTSVGTTLVSAVHALCLVLIIRPRMILTNGPGTAVPVCFVAWGLSWLVGLKCDTVYVESVCRVKSLSWSGRLMYRIAARFIVQWPELQRAYPRSQFHGLLV